ncbi:transposase DNA-binding-containing protein [Paraburkholderia rhynchosiae]
MGRWIRAIHGETAAKELIKRFANRPTASIPGACEGWAETMAAYRFLGNERIDWRDMMQPRWDRTTARMGALPVVLCIADTTELNFNGQDIEGGGAPHSVMKHRWACIFTRLMR